MAFTKTMVLPNWVTVTNAYVRIDTVSGSKDGLTIALNSYVSQAAFEGGASALGPPEYYSFVPSVAEDAPNFIEQGYVHLKTLPEYENAVDA